MHVLPPVGAEVAVGGAHDLAKDLHLLQLFLHRSGVDTFQHRLLLGIVSGEEPTLLQEVHKLARDAFVVILHTVGGGKVHVGTQHRGQVRLLAVVPRAPQQVQLAPGVGALRHAPALVPIHRPTSGVADHAAGSESAALVNARALHRRVHWVAPEGRVHLGLGGEAEHRGVAEEGHGVGQGAGIADLGQAAAPASAPTERRLAVEVLVERALPQEHAIRGDNDICHGIVRRRQHAGLRARPVVDHGLLFVAKIDVRRSVHHVGGLQVDVPDALHVIAILVLFDEEPLLHRLLALVEQRLVAARLAEALLGDGVAPGAARQLRHHVEDVHGVAVLAHELQHTHLALHVDRTRHVPVPHHAEVVRQLLRGAAPIKEVPVMAEGVHAQV
mmetsp:Transcript_91493/g.218075  ORF Transcript_91493/g.218075 Transcript_91493/m.218075 type:complete len:386 (-) Transcript_91493:2202-3359(-)